MSVVKTFDWDKLGLAVQAMTSNVEDTRDTWDATIGDFIDMPETMKSFLEDIRVICERHGLSIAHEDHQGSFIIEEYSKNNIDWLFEANKNY